MGLSFDSGMDRGGELKELKLLVVDGDDEHFDGLARYAEVCGFDGTHGCRLVSGGEAALDLLEQWAPSVVLVDLHIEGDGLGVIQALARRGVPVVALSKERIPEFEQRCPRYGAKGYFTKSTDPEALDALFAHIEGVLAERRDSH